MKVIAHGAADGQNVRLPPALMQPIVSDDVAALLADAAVGPAVNGTVEIAGPEPIRQDEMIRQFFAASGDARAVIVDPAALYFGTRLNDQSLTPGPNARLGKTRFQDWLKQTVKAA